MAIEQEHNVLIFEVIRHKRCITLFSSSQIKIIHTFNKLNATISLVYSRTEVHLLQSLLVQKRW